jgi:hypothetical protein
MKRLTILLTISLLAAGCGIIEPPRTPTPIYVTATPPPVTPTDTPPPAPSPVIAPLASAVAPSNLFPTATGTPLPTTAPTLTPSFTATFTESPAPTLNAKTCTVAPQGGFAAIYSANPSLQQALGCAMGPAVAVNSAVQEFESGRMIWTSQVGDLPPGAIYALFNAGTYQRFADNWVEGSDPVDAPGGSSPPAGRTAPIRGFGKVWGLNPSVRNGLNWALGGENGTGAQMQRFERGEMLFVAALNQTFIFAGTPTGGTWRADKTPF